MSFGFLYLLRYYDTIRQIEIHKKFKFLIVYQQQL